jgi:hypothetical protein
MGHSVQIYEKGTDSPNMAVKLFMIQRSTIRDQRHETGFGVGGGSNGSDASTGFGANSEARLFDCGNDTADGCRCIGEESLGFQDPTAFLVAFCEKADFVIPTSDSCDYEVDILNSTFGNQEICRSCSFLDSVNGWGIAYDCSI